MVGNDKFNPKSFIDEQVKGIKRVIGNNKSVIACSGGVDSTTCAVLTRKAIGENLICIFIDTNFMRLNEPEKVVKMLSQPPLKLPVRLINAQESFMKALNGLIDAEAKRKSFRNTFYSILSKVAKEENCLFLIQGTILPDVIETVKGIKTQHNVLEQMKINTREVYGFKVVEPLVSLYKPHVREVARNLGIPFETSERQPFPGPGLSVRVIGKITPDKLYVEKKATKIVEQKLKELKPKQYFPATIDARRMRYTKSEEVEEAISSLLSEKEITVKVEALRAKATGLRNGARLYGKVVTVEVRDERRACIYFNPQILDNLQRTVTDIDSDVCRVLYRVTDVEQEGSWLIAIRSIETFDFITASVSKIPWRILREIGELILNSCINISTIYYDITPKPPASIEFE